MPNTPQPMPKPRITPGTFVRLRRQALGLSIENLATMLDSVPGVSTQRRVEWLAAIENDVLPITVPTAWALHRAISLDLGVLSYWMEIAEGAAPSLVDALLACGAVTGVGPVFIGFDPARSSDLFA